MKYYNLSQNNGTAELMIYGDIMAAPMSDADVSAYSLTSELAAMNGVTEIDVHINSYGGECAEAMAIVNALRRHSAAVVTYNDGFACSAAATIFMAGDRRIASKYCNFLFHNAWTFVEGNSAQLRQEADNLDAITEQSKALYLEQTGMDEAALDKLMAQERFIGPEEALELGFATEIEDLTANQSERRTIMQKLRARLEAEAEPDKEEADEPEAEEEETETETEGESADPESADSDAPESEDKPAAKQAINPFAKFMRRNENHEH